MAAAAGDMVGDGAQVWYTVKDHHMHSRFNVLFRAAPLLLVSATGGMIAERAVSVASDHSNAKVEAVYKTVFFNDEARPFVDAPIIANASARTLRMIPEALGVFSMIELACNSVDRTGHLLRCKIRTDPASPTMVAIGKSLSQDLRLDPRFSRSVQGQIQFINIQVRVSNLKPQAWGGPCWPPSCSITPAPPPPPVAPVTGTIIPRQ